MLKKSIRNIIWLFTAFVLLTQTVYAEELSVPQSLSSYGEGIYAQARSYFGGRSFRGYCGTYVRCQLRAMGIFDGMFDFRGNGNQWYDNFENTEKTSGGYFVYRESGSDCIQKLTEKYGDNLKNIVMSFPIQAGYSASYPGAGHAFIIYEIKDGVAYFSESFGYGKYREGEVIAENVDSLMERYQRRHGSANGCVMLSAVDMEEEKEAERQSLLICEVKESIEVISDIDFILAELTHTINV